MRLHKSYVIQKGDLKKSYNPFIGCLKSLNADYVRKKLQVYKTNNTIHTTTTTDNVTTNILNGG